MWEQSGHKSENHLNADRLIVKCDDLADTKDITNRALKSGHSGDESTCILDSIIS